MAVSRSAARSARPGPRAAGDRLPLAVPDLDRAVELVLELMAIPGPSGEEGAVAGAVTRHLRGAGAAADWIQRDRAHCRAPAGGQTGNLVLRLPGSHRAPRRMFSAHLDTVPICAGARPVRRGNVVRSADAATGLGGDDRAGVAVILTVAREILERRLPHPPLTFCWFVQEEIGLQGSRLVNRSLLGRPRLAFNWDGGAPEKLTVGATSGYRMEIRIHGIPSHAGSAPERGVSAIAIAGLAIADLQRHGWHGSIRKRDGEGTSNLGVIHGGQATNVVTDQVRLRAEARSHDPAFRDQIVRQFDQAFRRAAQQVMSADGKCGQVDFRGRLDYEPFRLPADDPSVQAAEQAVCRVGREPVRAIANGGVDANWTIRYGIPAVTLGCGQRNPHTVGETLDIQDFRAACRIALLLATGSETHAGGPDGP